MNFFCAKLKSIFSVFCLVLFLFPFQFTLSAQNTPNDQLYQSTEFTAPNTFTNGVEGPAADKSGNVYAVNLDHQGTIGKVTPSGEASIFIELPEGSIGNGIRFDSKGTCLLLITKCIMCLRWIWLQKISAYMRMKRE